METDRSKPEKPHQQQQKPAESFQKIYEDSRGEIDNSSDRAIQAIPQTLMTPQGKEGQDFVRAIHNQYLEYQRNQALRNKKLNEKPVLGTQDYQSDHSAASLQKPAKVHPNSNAIVDRTGPVSQLNETAASNTNLQSHFQKRPTETKLSSSMKEPVYSKDHSPDTGRLGRSEDIYSFGNVPTTQRGIPPLDQFYQQPSAFQPICT